MSLFFSGDEEKKTQIVRMSGHNKKIGFEKSGHLFSSNA